MSQQQIAIFQPSIAVAGAVTKRRFVGYDGNQCTVQGQKVFGVAEMDASGAGKIIPVNAIGTAIVESGGVLAAGNSVISDAQGRAIQNSGALSIAAGATAVTSTAANGAILTGSSMPEYIVGDVMPGQAASGAGQFVEIILRVRG